MNTLDYKLYGLKGYKLFRKMIKPIFMNLQVQYA